MDLNLREAIIANIQNKSNEQLMEIMSSSISEKNEETLPGLGVLFEVIWENSTQNVRENLVSTLNQNIN